MLSKYQQIIKKINSFDFSIFDDVDLLNRITQLKDKLGNVSENIIAEVFAIIRQVIDRRLGIWKLFDTDLPEYLDIPSIRDTYNEVREKRLSIDSSQIYLSASFYSEVRELRQPQDGLTFTPFDVQLMGGLALLDGKISEMGTGEGKTVVAVFPACLWALSGKKVHIATVNDYLALRDCMWMGPIYRFLGLKVDCILSHMTDSERRNSYNANVVYGNNYDFGFDYLRDNLKNKLKDRVQNKLEYVIIDEIDSILMDEATTPLIISGAPDNNPSFQTNKSDYWKFKNAIESIIKHQNEIVEQLFREFEAESDPEIEIIRLIQIAIADPRNENLQVYISDNEVIKKMSAIHGKYIAGRSEYKLEEDLLYIIDEKHRTVKLTDHGISFIEQHLGEGFLTFPHNPPLLKEQDINSPFEKKGDFSIPTSEQVRNMIQLLRAYTLYRKDEDYIISNGNVIIVDEFTGRLAFGKKYEEGLHQAIECKEGLQITPENRVMGKITHPNYFRLYEKMAGMTATAHTEADEFKRLYKLEVVRIPTNKPVIRTDLSDKFYKTDEEKLEAIVKDIKECYELGRPVLIGTRSVEKSEHLSTMLTEHNIPHNVLNAKNHSEEAEIIKDAGQPYAVTIATNMAGRGTDIVLGKDLNLTPPHRGLRGGLNSNHNYIETVFRQGLHVIGTERHTARRIDDQLMGRAGRQGDPGSSRFYLSLQDDLFRLFASEEMPKISKAIEICADAMNQQTNKLKMLTKKAQRKSEETSYAIRKHLIEHDDVIDKQRKVIYKMREDILADNNEKRVNSLIADYVDDLIKLITGNTKSPEFTHFRPYLDSSSRWNDMRNFCTRDFGVHIPDTDFDDLNPESAKTLIIEAFNKTLEMREQALDREFSIRLAKAVMIEIMDTAWTDFLSFQSEFDNSIMLRSYVKSDVLVDYKLESAKLFKDLLASIRHETLKGIFTYPLPGEKMDSVYGTNKGKTLSDQIKGLL
jgi:preprotein translocase subunit SecA